MVQKKINRLLAGVLVTAMISTFLSGNPVAAKQIEKGISIADSSIEKVNSQEDNTDKEILFDIDTQDETYLTGEKAAISIEKNRQKSSESKSDMGTKKSLVKENGYHKQEVSETGIVQGKCGENVNYEINLSTGNVVISGNGAMTNYENVTDSPFYSYGDKIKSVEIKEGVTSVGKIAFGFCYDVDRIELPNSITSIEQWAFLGCISLEIIKIPEQVESIGNHSLGYYCSNGKEGDYKKTNITILGKSGSASETYATENGFTFSDQDALSGSCGDNLIWSYNHDSGVLTISGSGAMFDYIDDFWSSNKAPYYIYRFGITSVVLEEGVTAIGQEAFVGFEKLKEVKLSDTITEIGKYAFKDCTKLPMINLPKKLTTIRDYAFSNCLGLKSITIPETVSDIGANAFYNCMRLEQVEVETENVNYSSHQGVLYDKVQNTMILVPTNYPNSTLVIPDTVTTMGEYAIYHCRKLKYLIFEGNAPVRMNSFFQKLDDAIIYCNMSESSWESCIKYWPEGNGNWVNLSEMKGHEILSIAADSNVLKVGESIQLSAVLDPYLAVEFIWSSSDENVAVVSDTGKVNAIGSGTVQINVKSEDNQYSDKISITITGDAFSMPSYNLETLEGELDYTNIDIVTRQIISEKLHGIYFLNGKNLGFYSFVDGTYQIVKTFNECRNAYVANDKLYVLGNDTSTGMNTCYVYNLVTQSVVSKITLPGYELLAIGSDDDGRIYVSGYERTNSAKNKIFLLSEEGNLLSDLTVGTSVYDFSGFDHTNGCFYMESQYDYYAWGYSHVGRGLTMGKVTDNTLKYIDTQYTFLESGLISRFMGCLLYLYQNFYMEHQTNAELLGGRYLTAASVLHGSVDVFDSHSAGEDGINKVLTIERSATESDAQGSYSDCSSIGIRTVYNENRNSIIVYENDCNLSEYDLLTGEKIATNKTKHKVFNMMKMGDSLIIIEKEENSYYMEILDWGEPNQIQILAEQTVMKAGTVQTLTIESDKEYTFLPKWSSSDNSVLTVTQGGKLSAWKEGSAVITAKISESVSQTVIVTVTASGIVTPESNVITTNGAVSSNYSDNDYTVYGKVVNSNLVSNSDQTLTRVEYIGGTGVQIETYSKEFELLSSRVLPSELSYFGGFYAGKNANFLVFGQTNSTESDDAEVIRIVKYSKDWERQGQISVQGANTYIPFDAGSLRMAETNNGKLYIYTCHEMYADSDGVNHQSNMTFVLNEASMEMEQSFYDVMNIAQAGYVSHSFNQFVQTDDKYVFRVDHGDANPRAVSLTRCEVDGSITDVAYVLPLSINTYGYNDTGVSVGGLELSSENCLIVGNSVDQTKTLAYGNRNIFLSITAKSLTDANMIWLTNYTEESTVTARTPHIVKLNEEQFLILWEEYNSASKKTTVKMVTVDGEGNIASKIVETKLRLSDCKPIMTSDGLVKWYLTDNASTIFCVIDPYKLETVKGEIKISTENNASGDVNPGNPDDDRTDTPVSGTEFSNNKGQVIYVTTGKNEVQYKGGRFASGAVVIPDKINVEGKNYKVTSLAAGTFQNNKSITSVKIGKYVTSIGKNTFKGCKKLKSVKFGTAITSIRASAFENCIKLNSVTIGENVKTIGSKAFYGSKQLKKIIIKSKKLKTVGNNAIGGINKKATIKVPKNKIKNYKKLFKSKTGFKKTMKITS